MLRAPVTPILLLAILSTGCATHYGGLGPAHPRIARHDVDPVGHWVAVMTLQRGDRVRVLTVADGIRTGRFTASSDDYLLIDQKGTRVRIQRGDILRVDVLMDARSRARGVIGRAAAMALTLAGYEVILGWLFAGDLHMPPPRTWALGAAGGAAVGVVGTVMSRSRTIYVSPAAALAAAPTTGRR